MSASIVSKIEKLQEDLAAENDLMVKLAVKTEKAKTLSLKLNYTTRRVDELENEREIVKICISKVNQFLRGLVDTRNSILTTSVFQYLTVKLQPVFVILN